MPYDTIYAAMKTDYGWLAVIDGQFIPQWPVKSIREKNFLKVPLLIGSNTDEGISFGTTGVNTDAQAIEQLSRAAPPPPYSDYYQNTDARPVQDRSAGSSPVRRLNASSRSTRTTRLLARRTGPGAQPGRG